MPMCEHRRYHCVTCTKTRVKIATMYDAQIIYRGTAHGRITWQTIITHHCSCSCGFRRIMPFFVRVTCFLRADQEDRLSCFQQNTKRQPNPRADVSFPFSCKVWLVSVRLGSNMVLRGKAPRCAR